MFFKRVVSIAFRANYVSTADLNANRGSGMVFTAGKDSFCADFAVLGYPLAPAPTLFLFTAGFVLHLFLVLVYPVIRSPTLSIRRFYRHMSMEGTGRLTGCFCRHLSMKGAERQTGCFFAGTCMSMKGAGGQTGCFCSHLSRKGAGRQTGCFCRHLSAVRTHHRQAAASSKGDRFSLVPF